MISGMQLLMDAIGTEVALHTAEEGDDAELLVKVGRAVTEALMERPGPLLKALDDAVVAARAKMP